MSHRNRFSTAALLGLSLVLTLALSPMTFGQEAKTPAPTPAAASKSPDYVEEKGFKGKIFEIKYRDPYGLLQVVRPLGSGFKGATISVEPAFRTLTVRDFPENIAAIEEAIKRLDKPEAPRPDIEFSVHVLIASNSAAGSEDYPADLGDVIKQLKSALKYKSYALLTSSLHRAKEGAGVSNSGVAESNLFSSVPTPPNPIFFEYNLTSISIDSASGAPTVQVGNFRFNMRVPLNLGSSGIQYQNVGFQSPVSLRQGEKVVVGSTTMGDKGLVVVVSAKVLN